MCGGLRIRFAIEPFPKSTETMLAFALVYVCVRTSDVCWIFVGPRRSAYTLVIWNPSLPQTYLYAWSYSTVHTYLASLVQRQVSIRIILIYVIFKSTFNVRSFDFMLCCRRPRRLRLCPHPVNANGHRYVICPISLWYPKLNVFQRGNVAPWYSKINILIHEPLGVWNIPTLTWRHGAICQVQCL